MKLLLVAQIQVAQNQILVRIRGLAGALQPGVARGKLKRFDPQLARTARI